MKRLLATILLICVGEVVFAFSVFVSMHAAEGDESLETTVESQVKAGLRSLGDVSFGWPWDFELWVSVTVFNDIFHIIVVGLEVHEEYADYTLYRNVEMVLYRGDVRRHVSSQVETLVAWFDLEFLEPARKSARLKQPSGRR